MNCITDLCYILHTGGEEEEVRTRRAGSSGSFRIATRGSIDVYVNVKLLNHTHNNKKANLKELLSMYYELLQLNDQID